MKVQCETLEDNKVRLTVTIEAKEVDAKIRACYKDFAFKYNFPGFRKGKAPRQVIDTAIGQEAVFATVTDQLMKDTYPKAVHERDLYPMSRPSWEDEDAIVVQGKDFAYKALLDVKPEYELSSYEPVIVEIPSAEASEEEIVAQIDMLRDYSFTLEDAPASAKVAEESFMEARIRTTDEKGEEIDTLSADSRTIGLGSGAWPKLFEEQLIGMKKGQTKSFDLSSEDEEAAAFFRSFSEGENPATIHFEVEVLAVKKRVVPDLDDEWAVQMGFESVQLLKDGIKDSIEKQRSSQLEGLKSDKCLFELGERLEGEVPAALVGEAETRLMSNFFQQLQQQGWSLDAYLSSQELTSEQFKEDIKKQAVELCRQDLALDAWARHAGMKVTAEDITQEFAESGVEDPEKTEEEWRERGQMHLIKEGILRARASKEVIEGAVVKPPAESAENVGEKVDKKSTAEKTGSKKSAKPGAEKTGSKKPTKNAEEKSSDKKPAVKKAASK